MFANSKSDELVLHVKHLVNVDLTMNKALKHF